MDTSQDTPNEVNGQAPPLDDEELVDETPQFLNAGADAEEVLVDDDNVPMDEDEDDNAEVQPEEPANIIDMSKAKIVSHTDSVYAVCSHLDPATKTLTVMSGGGDDKAYLHKIAAGNPVPASHLLDHTHTDSVSCVALNLPYITEDLTKTPKLAAVGGYDGAIVLYDPDTGAKLKNLEGPTDVEWISFHPKGGTVLLAGSAADGTIWMYHIPMNKV